MYPDADGIAEERPDETRGRWGVFNPCKPNEYSSVLEGIDGLDPSKTLLPNHA
jgi:hypothetical protein